MKSIFSTWIMAIFLTGTPLAEDRTNTLDLLKKETISFNVLRKNSSVGYITLEKKEIGNKVFITATSEVNTKFILNFKASGLDKSIYQDNLLIYSSQFRKINNKVKVNQSISFSNGKYFFRENEKEQELNIDSIELNIIPLFFSEPRNIKQVYSDKFRQMVNVDCVGENIYRVALPNGEQSTYFYKNGKCEIIDVVGTFFKVQLLRKKS